jgi:hypothetical protein
MDDEVWYDKAYEVLVSIPLRPDQHASSVGPMDAYTGLDKFFSTFMIPQSDEKTKLPMGL